MSPEAAVTVAVIAGAVGFGYRQFVLSTTSSNTPTGTDSSGKKGKKKKKAAASSSASEHFAPSTPTPIVVPFPAIIPGGLDCTLTPESEITSSDAQKSNKSKKKKKNEVVKSATSKQLDSARPFQAESKAQASGSTSSTDNKSKIKNAGKRTIPSSPNTISSPKPATRQLNKVQSSVSIDTDGSWTRVESHHNKSGRSVDTTTNSTSEADPATGTPSPITERLDINMEADFNDDDHFFTRSSNPVQRRPLAERILPRPRKTGVESMLETPDHPILARVVRVSSHTVEQPASSFSLDDYEDAHDADVDGEDDNGGWDVVKSRRNRTIRLSTSGSFSSESKQKKAPETLTKRQRQNAARRETQKALKEEAEQERRALLAKHQRELEKERIKEQTRGRPGKKVSGGMKAVVSDTGKLVWE